jgi:hypothetical protein
MNDEPLACAAWKGTADARLGDGRMLRKINDLRFFGESVEAGTVL